MPEFIEEIKKLYEDAMEYAELAGKEIADVIEEIRDFMEGKKAEISRSDAPAPTEATTPDPVAETAPETQPATTEAVDQPAPTDAAQSEPVSEQSTEQTASAA